MNVTEKKKTERLISAALRRQKKYNLNTKIITADYEISIDDDIIVANTKDNDITITLPEAARHRKQFTVWKFYKDYSLRVIIDPTTTDTIKQKELASYTEFDEMFVMYGEAVNFLSDGLTRYYALSGAGGANYQASERVNFTFEDIGTKIIYTKTVYDKELISADIIMDKPFDCSGDATIVLQNIAAQEIIKSDQFDLKYQNENGEPTRFLRHLIFAAEDRIDMTIDAAGATEGAGRIYLNILRL